PALIASSKPSLLTSGRSRTRVAAVFRTTSRWARARAFRSATPRTTLLFRRGVGGGVVVVCIATPPSGPGGVFERPPARPAFRPWYAHGTSPLPWPVALSGGRHGRHADASRGRPHVPQLGDAGQGGLADERTLDGPPPVVPGDVQLVPRGAEAGRRG